MTFIAALRHDRIDAPVVFDGPINEAAFLLYGKQVLIPTLKLGDIVVLDNLSSHKSKEVKSSVRANGSKVIISATLLTRPQPNRTSLLKKIKHLIRKPLNGQLQRLGNSLELS